MADKNEPSIFPPTPDGAIFIAHPRFWRPTEELPARREIKITIEPCIKRLLDSLSATED